LDDAPPRPELVVYLNRLSDLLFVLARRANRLAGVEDVPWNPRLLGAARAEEKTKDASPARSQG
jgi:hypothetical protein